MIKPNEVVKQFKQFENVKGWKIHIPKDLENYPIQVFAEKNCFGEIKIDDGIEIIVDDRDYRIEYFAFSNYLLINSGHYNLNKFDEISIRFTCGSCLNYAFLEKCNKGKCDGCSNKEFMMQQCREEALANEGKVWLQHWRENYPNCEFIFR